ncbi:hypothetical protein RJ640_022269 [Escallonia rubra]|uniref:J domain-containing protein n=1 Tax=Escallonia rubra TaxID=112253 RepID=A0AA88U9E4_9ASTE|nr:hypothetical protein RJ640_022269 [Escallonia rubra]
MEHGLGAKGTKGSKLDQFINIPRNPNRKSKGNQNLGFLKIFNFKIFLELSWKAIGRRRGRGGKWGEGAGGGNTKSDQKPRLVLKKGPVRRVKQCQYKVLGLGGDCTAGEIRSAYHRLVLQCHPDKLAQFRISPAAYRRLSLDLSNISLPSLTV